MVHMNKCTLLNKCNEWWPKLIQILFERGLRSKYIKAMSRLITQQCDDGKTFDLVRSVGCIYDYHNSSCSTSKLCLGSFWA